MDKSHMGGAPYWGRRRNHIVNYINNNWYGRLYNKGHRFLNFEFVHPDSGGESNPKTH